MKKVLCLIMLLLIFCNPVYQKIENNLQDSLPPIRDAFTVKVSGHEDSPQHLALKLNLSKNFSGLSKIENTEPKEGHLIGTGDSTTGVLNLDLSKGKYYGKLRVSDTNIYPLLMTSFSSMEIYFGYTLKEKKTSFWQYLWNGTEYYTVENKKEICYFVEKTLDPTVFLYRPAVVIDEKKLFHLDFNISNATKFSPKGTSVIWLGAFLSISFTFGVPIGLVLVPVSFGPFAIERKIEYKQTPNINSEISKEQ